MTTILHILCENPNSDLPSFQVLQQPSQESQITLLDALDFSAGALFLRCFCESPKVVREAIYNLAKEIRQNGRVAIVPHKKILTGVDIKMAIQYPSEIKLDFATAPSAHRNEEVFQTSIASLLLSYIDHVLTRLQFNPQLLWFGLDQILANHPKSAYLEWLPVETSDSSYQLIVNELMKLIQARISSDDITQALSTETQQISVNVNDLHCAEDNKDDAHVDERRNNELSGRATLTNQTSNNREKRYKIPWLAVILNLIPGLGYLYIKESNRFFGLFLFYFLMTVFFDMINLFEYRPILITSIILFSLFDVHSLAKKHNRELDFLDN